MLLAEMVAPEVRIIGLYLDRDAIQHATEQAVTAQLRNVSFVHCDFAQYVPDVPLDAIVGRMVLMYQSDPAATLSTSRASYSQMRTIRTHCRFSVQISLMGLSCV